MEASIQCILRQQDNTIFQPNKGRKWSIKYPKLGFKLTTIPFSYHNYTTQTYFGIFNQEFYSDWNYQ